MSEKIKISPVGSTAEREELDKLLWIVLWKPLSLPRNIRNKFEIEGERIEIVAKSGEKLIGCLVAYCTAPEEWELRHIAVLPEFQKQGIGKQLVEYLITYLQKKKYKRLYTIARNTSLDFFRKLGFKEALTQKPPDHPIFKKHSITFHLLEKTFSHLEEGKH